MDTVLTITPHFPSPADSADGQANYLTTLAPILAEVENVQLRVIALKIGDQADHEHGDGWSVSRIAPPKLLPDIFSLYLPENLRPSLRTLKAAALKEARQVGTHTPAWCHGYETGEIVEELHATGHRVVGVVHYSVGVETLHDLALGDDAVRQEAFDSPWATRLGQLWPRTHREMGVRWASRVGGFAQHTPLPHSIQTQFTKLALERKLIGNASHIVAVGPSFETEINQLYPCTVSRSSHVIAGPPAQIPQPRWPRPITPDDRRFIMVGRPTGQKGWDYAAEALSQLSADESRRIQLVMIGGLGEGNGPYSAYSARVAQRFSELSHIDVHNLGALSHTETLSHLAAADLLLFPSVFEPLGLVLLEAMAARCCVLASDAAGPSDLVSAPWGIQVPFKDPTTRSQELTRGIRSFLEWSRTRIDQAAEDARSRAADFSWRTCASAHGEVLLRGG